jgi:MoaA/NifB/PqqE/SkfB family radical SAM enzyme
MNSKSALWAEVDDHGHLVLPSCVSDNYGLEPGARLRIDVGQNDFRLHRPVTHLAKLYIEPTNKCNLSCVTCIRNHWDVEYGKMSETTFDCIMKDVRALPSPPKVFIGGLGEPLSHPAVADMVGRAKALGSIVELITNGTLLTEEMSHRLVASGLDTLWVSLDGARPESYADVRLGANLPQVLENLVHFRRARSSGHFPKPEIGIVFVAMKRNIDDLPEVLALGRSMRVSRFMVTNLLPYTVDMCDDILYRRTLSDKAYLPSSWVRQLYLPKMDIDPQTGEAILQALRSGYNVIFAGNNLGVTTDVCTFIESGSMAIGWDGSVSPCPPLLYNHTGYLQGKERRSHRHVVGNVEERSIMDLWQDPDYIAYRDRVQRFAFAPCTFCGGCDLSEANQTDCFSNPAPACGGCLWSQGVIQCP